MSPKLPSLRFPSLHRLSALIGLGVVFSLTSCGGPTTTEQSKQSDAETAKIQESKCESLLSSTLQRLHPEHLGLDAARESAVNTLNQWATSCGTSHGDLATISPAGLAAIKTVASAEQVDHMLDVRFSARDGKHVRTCVMVKQIAEFVTSRDNYDLDRVLNLFEFVTRNIDLRKESDDPLPNTVFAALLFGRGTAEDRAWVFCELLRQLKIDSVIIHPAGDQPAGNDKLARQRWLIGVLIDEKVYLFDSRLGTPIPSSADTGETITVREPATLTQVREDDSLLRQLDLPGGRPYPLRSSDLEKVRVETIGVISYWIPRMERLQKSLTAQRAVVIYDPVDDNETTIGLLGRVAEYGAGRWEKTDITLWPHPEHSLHTFENMNPSQRQRYFVLQAPLSAPIPFAENEKQEPFIDPNTGKLAVTKPKREHQRGRIRQLLGDFESAVRSYTSTRIDSRFDPRLPVPDEVRIIHASAGDNATFWGAVSQLEMSGHQVEKKEETLGVATVAFRTYLRQHEKSSQPGPWTGLCQGLLATTLAKKGEFDRAIKQLDAVSKNDPKKEGYELLARRWKTHLPETPDATKAEKPSDDKTTGTEQQSPKNENKSDAKADQTAQEKSSTAESTGNQ